MRNGHPLIAAAGVPDIEEASVQGGMRLDATYLSVFLNSKKSDHWITVVDMESAVVDLRAAKAFGDRMAVGLDVPVYYFGDGFMDSYLNDFHHSFNLANYGREDRPNDEFLLIVMHDGKTVIKGIGNRWGLGDVRTWGKWQFRKDSKATISFYGFVDLPTGNAYRGYGNGSYDFGTALLADYRYSESIELFANAGRVFPGDYEGRESIELYDYFYAALGASWRYSDDTFFVTQATWGQSPYRFGISAIDDDWVLWGVGATHRVGNRGNVHLMFTEDPAARSAPDFMLTLGYEYRL